MYMQVVITVAVVVVAIKLTLIATRITSFTSCSTPLLGHSATHCSRPLAFRFLKYIVYKQINISAHGYMHLYV